ncbi:hypothetical protein M378DRAFT_173768, partial [Amanita muscaria Koide BX008]
MRPDHRQPIQGVLLVSFVRGRDTAVYAVDKSGVPSNVLLVWVREMVMISVLLLQAHCQALPPTMGIDVVIDVIP